MIQQTHLKKKAIEIEYENTFLVFNSNFDSGNLWKAEVNKETNEIILQAGKDRQNVPSLKNWFYFTIEGEYKSLNLRLVLEKCNILQSISKVYDGYRPVVRVQGGKWKRLGEPVEFETVDSILRMKFNVKVENSEKIEIALIYPWTVKENQSFLKSIQKRVKQNKGVYYNQEVIVYSPEKRPVHLISISSVQVLDNRKQDYLQGLFPDRQQQDHYRYTDKPIVLITSRVHPGEVGSSHACNGMIKFLTSDHKIAEKLRKQFFFWIIPMLNPDGVFNGNNRMDSLGQNLNRFYHLPDREKQPSCFAVKSLVESCRKQLYAFFDLHGHANKKSCFLYGNSIPLARLQAESLLYAKLLSMECDEIDFNMCNFTKKHMSSKDKSDELTKEGCARVVIHKWSGSPYCYTLETGLFKNIKIDDKGIERYSQQFYSIEIYEIIGQKMLICFYETLAKNSKMDELRKQMLVLASKLQKPTTRVTKSQKELLQPKGGKGKQKEEELTEEMILCQKIGKLSLDKEYPSAIKSDVVLQKKEERSGSLQGSNKNIQKILRKSKQQMVDLEDEDVYD